MKVLGKLIVITGQTGSGKDTVVEKLLTLHPTWKKIVTTTTRQIRPGETNHKEYNFIDKTTFQKLNSENGFLEINEYAGNFYGTPKSALDPLLSGQSLIWRIDISMAAKVIDFLNNAYDSTLAQELIDNTKIIFLKLEDNLTQKKRLEKRGMKESDVNKRIEQENKDLAQGKFQNIVINHEGKLEETVKTVEKIINF